jgi:Raf kinase inhibitor-like YbhB/YbcL family protein
MTLRLTSPAFADGETIPPRFTCDGANHSPPLAWSGAPAETRSFALLCRDPDAPAGTWYHWAAFDISPRTAGLDENCGSGLRQAVNDFKRPGYGGPCPPHGHGRHRYQFLLYALDAEHLELRGAASCREAESAFERHAVAKAQLVGTYQR